MEASAQLFGTRSPDDVTIRSVAERAGVSVGSLYQYFEGRDGLLDAMLERVTRDNFDRFVERLQAARNQPIDHAVEVMVDEVLETYLGRRLLTRAATAAAVGFGRVSAVQAERDRFVRVLADHLASRLPDVDPEEVFLRTSIAADLVVGAALAQAHRPRDEQREQRLREMACRTMTLEVSRLAKVADGAHS
ncbi:MAG: helix-turn-helix domain-containing protein [Myxococcota bacterium]